MAVRRRVGRGEMLVYTTGGITRRQLRKSPPSTTPLLPHLTHGTGDTALPLADVIPSFAWENKPCYIIGGGPSLPVTSVRRALKGRLTIGVNRAWEILDPCINYSMDTKFLKYMENGMIEDSSSKEWKNLDATRVLLWNNANSSYQLLPDCVIPQMLENYTLSRDLRKGIRSSSNSGFGALHLAFALGANPIYLLGYDMKGGKDGKQVWWHSGYPRITTDHVYKNFINVFNKFANCFEEAGVSVYNLNPDSALKCFEKKDYSLLNEFPNVDRPLVVGYYTRNTPYEKEIKNMTKSVHRFGLEYYIEGIEDLGNWQYNTYYKCKFMKKMLKKFPGRKLLFLDADVIMRRYPEIFDNCEDEFAVNIVDWSAYTNKNKKELNTSVIFFRDTRNVNEMLDAWEKLNNERIDTGIWEQKNLQEIVERGEFKIRNIPDTYCQIYDTMKEAGKPVIELFQASRRFKT